MTIREWVEQDINKMPVGEVFSARDLARRYGFYVSHMTHGKEYRNPYSDTIGRILRDRRSRCSDVFYFDYGRSLWWKNDHVASRDEMRLHELKHGAYYELRK